MKEINNMEDFNQILREAGNKLVVVDFNATWCGPCKAIRPVFKQMESTEEFKNVVFCEVDVDEAPEVAEDCDVQMMPAFMFFKNGEKIKEVLGANKDKLKASIIEIM
ncbi:thioredoxin-like [Pecten maximus]|uniref:thioredoxin-like n=1 Tax=Pecten maximus TaxID=6579 RepID=UPI00145830FE|nr:thioredoxin-like [Pecten maximus]